MKTLGQVACEAFYSGPPSRRATSRSPVRWEASAAAVEAEVKARLAAQVGPLTMTAEMDEALRSALHTPGGVGDTWYAELVATRAALALSRAQAEEAIKARDAAEDASERVKPFGDRFIASLVKAHDEHLARAEKAEAERDAAVKERDEVRETLASITVPCSCTHEAGDSPCELHPVCEYCGEPAGPATCHCATMDGRCHGCPMTRHELETSLAELESALTREREAHARLEEALGDIVQRIDENPNETCPFCEPVQHDGGADHEPECLITAAHAALRGAR